MRIFMWWVRTYKWCAACQQRAANTDSELCPSCQAALDVGLKQLLKEK